MLLFPFLFILGYTLIVLEHPLRINKSAVALFLGGGMWLLWFAFGGDTAMKSTQLTESLSSVASILFFLMGAMTIVLVVDFYDGFSLITNRIKTNNIRVLLWQVSWITFFISAILDNMTTTIIMVTLVRKILPKAKDRKFFSGMIIVAANAGGVFSPIGDVTTTMLWISGHITGAGIISETFLPSVVALLVPLLLVTRILKGKLNFKNTDASHECVSKYCADRYIVFFFGVFGLILVPILKALLDIPPYMGILFSLGLLWLVTDVLLQKKQATLKMRYSITSILKSVDMSSILFFAGILFAVSVLESTGQLKNAALYLQDVFGSIYWLSMALGLLSSIVDNVPLVAASMGMYEFPTNHLAWASIAFAAGTGGSLLIIGSAAGVVTMGLEKISFGWYLKWIAPYALLGYGAGFALLVFMGPH
ncbi:MAG: sodium:proton antiporter [Fibrobacter sp.]|jgi:Na+/H+ antiporter NhaD/arsenite permease-like protein|nr:sodium:proton antiporter [Fibrobacter sp.]